jgi:hypothetical protein
VKALATVRRSSHFAAYAAEDAAVTHCRLTTVKPTPAP